MIRYLNCLIVLWFEIFLHCRLCTFLKKTQTINKPTNQPKAHNKIKAKNQPTINLQTPLPATQRDILSFRVLTTSAAFLARRATSWMLYEYPLNFSSVPSGAATAAPSAELRIFLDYLYADTAAIDLELHILHCGLPKIR